MRPLHTIAREISASISDQLSARKNRAAPAPAWVHYSRPYLVAMATMQDAVQPYGHDSGYSIVAYFLSNAGPWRGPNAKALRAELKEHLDAANAARAGGSHLRRA